jgi:hypothetical protein
MSSSSTNYEVRKIVGKAPWNVLYCHSCIPPVLPNVADIKPHEEFSWALNLRCFKCNSKWIICTICSNTRTGMTTKTQLYLHNHKKHNDHIESHQKYNVFLLNLILTSTTKVKITINHWTYHYLLVYKRSLD